jgi:hypothetical protein
MKTLLILSMLALCSCSTPKGKYKEEQNTPKFATSRSFSEKPETVLRAARAVLDEIQHESDPPASGSLRGNEESVATGWVYSTSKDKYVEYKHNGTPHRKILPVRRKYTYTALPSLGGSEVTFGIDEEIQVVDLNSGEPKGWKNVAPAQSAYDDMAQRLRQKIHAQ